LNNKENDSIKNKKIISKKRKKDIKVLNIDTNNNIRNDKIISYKILANKNKNKSYNIEKLNNNFYEPSKNNDSNNNNKNLILYEIINLENPKEINSKYPSCLKKLKAKLDILLICHGISIYSKIKECSTENFDKIMNINVRSVFHLLSISVPFLKLTKGNCVILSSLESFIPKSQSFLNTTSKAMINSLVQNSALELSSFGVRINAVAPSVINKEEKNDINNFDFNFGKIYGGGLGDGSDEKKMFPLGKKFVEKENVAETILFLASEQARMLTGQVIKVSGGHAL
jgi:NAD(P)-dependent dehydrogenase (short-subunit alcohol dehydrogenase family)